MSGRDDMPAPDPELAAELALGLLDGDERLEAERWRQADPAFAEEVRRWEMHFAQIADEVHDVAPRGKLQARIEKTLWGGGPERARGRKAKRARRPSWLDGLWTGILTGAASAAILAAIVFDLGPGGPGGGVLGGPEAVAELIADGTGFRAYALLTDDGSRVALGIAEGEAPPGRVLQLWAVRGDDGPYSLGLIETDVGLYELPETLRSGDGQLIVEVSEEPLGGSPEQGPTGQVLGVGEVREIASAPPLP